MRKYNGREYFPVYTVCNIEKTYRKKVLSFKVLIQKGTENLTVMNNAH